MRKLTLALAAASLLFTLNSAVVARASTPQPLWVGTNVAQMAEQAPIHWVSVAQIENSLLGRPPMAVGFDIDDTVLFSSPGFWRGQKTFSPGSEDYLKNPQFWEKMNNGWDEFSIPKEVARQLIDMHVRRGDAIFFVTGRSPTKTETVSVLVWLRPVTNQMLSPRFTCIAISWRATSFGMLNSSQPLFIFSQNSGFFR